jgi:uncharacterized protein YpiB (UPF0302 family)
VNLIGQIVTHKSFGEGKVIKCNDNYITIRFFNCEKTFSYPSSFNNFLTAKDNQIDDEIKMEIIILEHQKKAEENVNILLNIKENLNVNDTLRVYHFDAK